MKMSVRDIRQKWPEAERALALEGEIIVTRDSKPVAKIIPFTNDGGLKRPRFDPVTHGRWLLKFWKNKPVQPSLDEELTRDRAERG